MSTVSDEITAYTMALQAWRDQQETELRATDGWLTVVGLFWLHDGENSVGSDPAAVVALPDRLPAQVGSLILGAEGVTWQSADGVDARVDGQRAQAARLSADPRRPSLIQVEEVTIFLIQRGDRMAARVRDAASEARRNFTGRVWYPIDPALRVRGKFLAHASQRALDVETVIGTTVRFSNPGAVTFEVDGQPQRLEAFAGEQDGELWFLFRDGTSGGETYGAGRELVAVLHPDHSVDLDFNKAENPPCVFTPYATCPLPPRDNHLPIAVRAGERLPRA